MEERLGRGDWRIGEERQKPAHPVRLEEQCRGLDSLGLVLGSG